MVDSEADLTENGVNRVHGDLILGSVTDQSFGIGETDVRRRRPVTLVIGDDFDTVVLPDSDA